MVKDSIKCPVCGTQIKISETAKTQIEPVSKAKYSRGKVSEKARYQKIMSVKKAKK